MGYQLIEHIEVGSGGASLIEFTSIPQDGVDLMVKASLRSDAANDNTAAAIFLSGDLTSGNYQTLYLRGASHSTLNQVISAGGGFRGFIGVPAENVTANTFSNTSIYISNYASTSDKSLSIDGVFESNGASVEAQQLIMAVGHTTSTGTSAVKLDCLSGDFVEYSTASLYKITAD